MLIQSSLLFALSLFLLAATISCWKLPFNHLISQKLSKKSISIGYTSKTLALKFKTADSDDSYEPVIKNEKSPEQAQVDKILFLRRLSNGVIPLAASFGFAVTPSTRAIVRIAGAAAGGVAGVIAKRSIDKQVESLKNSFEYPMISTSNGFFDGGGDDNDEGTEEYELDEKIMKFPQKVADGAALQKEITGKEYPGWDYSDSGQLRDNEMAPPTVALAVERTFTKYKAIEDFDLKQLEVIAKASKVKEDDLTLYFTLLLSEYIFQFTDSESLYLLDFQPLFQFIRKIDFSFSEIADAVTLAANNLGKRLDKDEIGFYSEKFPVKYFLQAAKLFYLCDKLIGSFEGYYGARAKTVLSYFPDDEYRNVITKACQKLMIDLLNEILNAPYDYTPQQFEEMKFLLTTSKEASDFTLEKLDEMITTLFQTLVADSLRLNNNERTMYSVALPALEEIQHFSDLFHWNYSKIQQVFEPVTSTLFRKIVHDIFTKVTADSSLGKAYEGVLEERMEAFQLPFSVAKSIIKSEVEALNDQAVHNIMSSFNKSNENIELTYRQLISYAISIEEISKITKTIFPNLKPLSIAQFPLKQSDLIYAYTMNALQRDKLIEGGKLSAELLEEMFDLPKETFQTVYRMIVVPKIVSFIQQCIQEKNYRPEMHQAVMKKWQQEDLSLEEYQKVAMTIYFEQVEEVLQQPGRIPSFESNQNLQQIAQFLNLTTEIVQYVHVAVFGDRYLQAVEECMSTTGVVTPEYMDNLERLRESYGLSTEDAGYLFSLAIMNRFRPNVYAVYDLFKSITDPKYDAKKEQAQRRKRQQKEEEKRAKKIAKLAGAPSSSSSPLATRGDDMIDDEEEGDVFHSKYSLPASLRAQRKEEDLAPTTTVQEQIQKELSFLQRQDAATEAQRATFMKEVVNLVETVDENYQLQSFDLMAREDYPIRATGAVNASELVDMYRYFLISKLMEANPTMKQRYDAVDSKFSNLLGLPWQTRNQIKQVLLQDIYATTIKNLLETKDAVEATDLQQFYLLADEFNVTDADLRKDLYEYTVRRGIDDYANTFLRDEDDDAPEAKLNPAQARRFRKQVLDNIDLT